MSNSFALDVPLGIFGLGSLDWDLPLGIFCLGKSAWDLSLGSFRPKMPMTSSLWARHGCSVLPFFANPQEQEWLMSLAPRAPREFVTPILSESTHTRVRNSFGAPSTEKNRCYSRECTNMGATNSFGARRADFATPILRDPQKWD